MPYRCARAVCATFCHDIAGALIPLFGPSFPSECTPPDSPCFGEMIIEKQLVLQAATEAKQSHQGCSVEKGATWDGSAGSPQMKGFSLRGPLSIGGLHDANISPPFLTKDSWLMQESGGSSQGRSTQPLVVPCNKLEGEPQPRSRSELRAACNGRELSLSRRRWVDGGQEELSWRRTSRPTRAATTSWACKRHRPGCGNPDDRQCRDRLKAAKLDHGGVGKGEGGQWEDDRRRPSSGHDSAMGALAHVSEEADDDEVLGTSVGPGLERPIGAAAERMHGKARQRARSC